ncbi:PAS domain S-box protein [Dechloromonas sp. XY25]|uniref:PAS domain S-box protein n=1 Tax=Dechloromonas hankyongensis TaxID=2908002 RepID=A0ABS9JZH0_9RHOO|nr:PAS domain S-box protein [Dechloromonas hankyongensis]MCG2576303.1 PAS domain S-box protein [Dechloromonas hankyongensis]
MKKKQSLNAFLTLLIGICIAPLVLLAAYLAKDSIQVAKDGRDQKAFFLAHNFATALDQNLTSRIKSLNMLALSPLADNAARWPEFYREAQNFQQSFDSHVIFADTEMRMLFNTRTPYGTALPALPRPDGRAAAPLALATGKPAISDLLHGPIAKAPLVAIAVPVLRDGKAVKLLLTTLETKQLQQRLEQLALPQGWSMAVVDGNKQTIARVGPPEKTGAAGDPDGQGRVVAPMGVAPWSVVLEIPRDVYRTPLVSAGLALAAAIVVTVLASVLGGLWASRRLAREVISLTGTDSPEAESSIIEIATARELLVSANNALQEGERRFRATFDQAAVGIAHVGPDGHWLRVNERLCEIVGYSSDELLDKSFQDITHPDDLALDEEYVRQVLAGELAFYSMEKRYWHKSGTIVWINLTVSLVRKADGSPDYFISVVEDISSRKNTEARLAEKQQVLKNLAGIASDYFWAIDERFRFTQISSSIAKHSKLDYQEYIGKTRWEIPCVGVDAAAWAQHRATLENHQPFRNFELGLVNRDGELRWFVISGDPIFGVYGEFKGYRGVTQDVTGRRKSEETLRLHAAVFSSVQEGIVITDIQGTVLAVNPAFTAISEYAAEEVVGNNMRLLRSGRHDEAFYSNMYHSLEVTGFWQGEIWNRRKSGEVYPEWIAISSVRNAEGELTHYIGVQIDMSRMQHTETKLERLAQYDALTELPNRLLLATRLEHTVERAKRHRMLGAVLYIDLDRFKPVNDTLGHAAGDELLQLVAKRLGDRLRGVDTLARQGGDEFVVVLDEINNREGAAHVAQSLINELQKPFVLSGERAVQIGGSIGIAMFPEYGEQPEQLIELADQALYQAKRSGRGRFAFYQA